MVWSDRVRRADGRRSAEGMLVLNVAALERMVAAAGSRRKGIGRTAAGHSVTMRMRHCGVDRVHCAHRHRTGGQRRGPLRNEVVAHLCYRRPLRWGLVLLVLWMLMLLLLLVLLVREWMAGGGGGGALRMGDRVRCGCSPRLVA